MKNVRSALARALSVVASLAVVATVVVAPVVAPAVAPQAQAANASAFDPGNIIDDQIFFDSGTMSEADIQAFLNSKVPSCRSGYTCLKDYRESTRTIPATPMCGQYDGAASESAARIIYKVALACGINPKVLIVVLQKEQGLVTSTGPGARAYRSAMGAGCPDTAACDANYYGFFNQMHYGAYLMKRYTQPKGTGYGTAYSSRFDLMYPVGKTTNIQYNPNAGCGTKPVYIANQATHVLYVYTPYTPNQAALNAGYGIGDSCSAYGNRNFFFYFSDWFGSTRYQPYQLDGEIKATYLRLGGEAGYLGRPIANPVCGLTDGGCYQAFRGGQIHWSAKTGAHATDGGMLAAWKRVGMEAGKLGYPLMEPVCGLAQGGCYQDFQGGGIHWTAATGAHATEGAIRTKWRDLGWEGSFLGYPTTDWTCTTTNAGCFQDFQGGTITWTSASGAVTIDGAIRAAWRSAGAGTGTLGYPAGAAACGLRDGACVQDFQKGSLVWTAAKGTLLIGGPIWATWTKLGAEGGALGYPLQAADSTGSLQLFEGGEIRWNSTTGAHGFLNKAIKTAYDALKGASGYLRQPTSSTACTGTGCTQTFQGGTLAVASGAAAAYALDGAILARWEALGGAAGSLKYPTANPVCANGTCTQNFQNGRIYWSSGTGATAVVNGAVATEWQRLGATSSYLGWPTGDTTFGLTGGGSRQSFRGGAIYAASTGAGYALDGAMLAKYQQLGAEKSGLGYPTGSPACASGVCKQTFQGGQILWSSSTGATALLNGAVATEYQRLGGTTSYLGLPTGDTLTGLTGGGSRQSFRGGAIYAAATGAGYALDGAMLAKYQQLGAEKGALGYPTGSPACASGVCKQTFQGGQIFWSGRTGATALVNGAVATEYQRLGGTASYLGLPTGDTVSGLAGGGSRQSFTGGSVYAAPNAAGYALDGAILALYLQKGAEKSNLGYPTSSPTRTSTAPLTFVQKFQGGTITWTAGKGAVSP
ncbi:MAG: hypothetical protein M3116_00105 [Actinomycetota bacterium]|nr:hypothetical protein [Actinomycetota bacterium]